MAWLYPQVVHFCKHSPKASLAETTEMQRAAEDIQQVSACNAAPEEISKSNSTAFTFDLFLNQKSVVVLFCFILSPAPLLFLSHLQPQIHFTEFLPFMFFSYQEYLKSGKAKYHLLLSVHQLSTGIFHSSSHTTGL